MRTILGIFLSLVFIGLLAYLVDTPSRTAVDNTLNTQWRRTSDGWEQASTLWKGVTARSKLSEIGNVQPHPLVLSLLMGLFSTLLLVAFSPESAPMPPRRQKALRRLREIPLRSAAWIDDGRLR